MNLELFDSILWSLNSLLISINCYNKNKFIESYLLLFLNLFSWINNYFDERKSFRSNCSSAIICGLLSVPTTLISLNSIYSSISLSNSFLNSLLFLITSQNIPTFDIIIFIPLLFLISTLFSYFYEINFLILLISLIFSSFVLTILMKFTPKSFSIGELLIVSSLSSLPIITFIESIGINQINSSFILSGILILCISLLFKNSFLIFFGLIPLYNIIFNFNLIFQFIFNTFHLILLFYCLFICLLFIFLSIYWKGLLKFPQIIQRKFFHLMALLVFIPPALLDVEWLKFSISIAIFGFLFIESLRIVKFPIIYNLIINYVSSFIDERDSGELILTHLHLLLGCGLPILFNKFENLLGIIIKISGISVLAIGDAAASAIGIKFGKHKWPGSKKSLEGTLGAFIFTWICLILIIFLSNENINLNQLFLLMIPSLISSIDEAFTSQIDNLTLPFIIIPSIIYSIN